VRIEEAGDAVGALVGGAALRAAGFHGTMHRRVGEEVAVRLVPDALQVADEEVAVRDGPREVAKALGDVARGRGAAAAAGCGRE
jgi:hypothetical protein